MKGFVLISVVFLGCFAQFLSAQEKDSVVTWKMMTLTGTLTGGFLAGNALNHSLWWKGEQSSFHFDWKNDSKYALNADKFGHFFFPYFLSFPLTESFIWAGYSEKSAKKWAAGTALLYQTYIEVRDGFSQQWGFSWGDFAADVLGAAYPLIQHEYPRLKNLSMKLSFYPSNRFKNNSHSVIFDDYESTLHWITIHPHIFFPNNVDLSLPGWLNVALGYGVQKLDSPSQRSIELYLALDYSLSAITEQGILGKLFKLLDYYHFPSPAVRIYPNVVWYGLKF